MYYLLMSNFNNKILHFFRSDIAGHQGIQKTVNYTAALLIAFALAGCMGGGGSSIRYYLIDPVDLSVPGEAQGRGLSIEITDLHIPQYLERFQIVTRDLENRLHLSENNQWGENLRKNLLRTLAQNLAVHLSTIDIGTPLNRSASLPDYRIQIYISQFERDTDGIVRLAARWQISDGSENVLGMHSAVLDSGTGIEENNYGAIVSSMQDLFGKLSARIAETVMDDED